MEKKNDILWRMRLVYFMMVLFGLMIIGRVAYLQFVEGDYWKELSRTAIMRYERIDAVRGDIFADDGSLLATSIPVYEIRMDLGTQVVSDELFHSHIDSLALGLSRLFGDRSASRYRSDLLRARENQERYHLVKRNVSREELNKLQTLPLFRLGRFRGGLIVVEHSRREMPYKNLAARTIGYEREGVYVGLEGGYRDYLEGIQGKRLMQRISGGAWMPVSDQNEIRPQNGMDIVTTINVQIQDITEKALLRQLHEHRAGFGTAVVMEVATGQVKAIANLALNPQTNTYEETYNFAVGHSTEPGSTFKLASMIAAIEDRYVQTCDSVETGQGYVIYHNRRMSDASMAGHGMITVREAFALSSNVGISRIIYDAYENRPQQFVDRLRDLHLHEPLGLEISGEGQPVIRNAGEAGWSKISLPWMAIGYEVSLTPLQILTLYNAVANNGRMMKPIFVSEIRSSGITVKRFPPVVIDRSVASPSTIRAAQEVLTSVVESGTARNIHTEAYPIAGKTGTAQVAQRDRGYQTQTGTQYLASFAGYFPADQPKYSCLVMIHNPSGSAYTGNRVAAPVFRNIADQLFAAQYFNPRPTVTEPSMAHLPRFSNAWLDDVEAIYAGLMGGTIEQELPQWGQARVKEGTAEFRKREFIENLVPEVIGMGLRDAVYVLENAGLRVRFSGRGTVKSQSLSPGTRIQEGSIIDIKLS